MNIEEAQIKKRMIESQILTLIQQFEKDVDLQVSYINIESLISMAPSTIHVELEVKL